MPYSILCSDNVNCCYYLKNAGANLSQAFEWLGAPSPHHSQSLLALWFHFWAMVSDITVRSTQSFFQCILPCQYHVSSPSSVKQISQLELMRNTSHRKHLPEEQRAGLRWKKVAIFCFITLFFITLAFWHSSPLQWQNSLLPNILARTWKNDCKTYSEDSQCS